MLVSGSPDKSILIWGDGRAPITAKLLGHSDKVYCVKFSGDSKLIASVG
jgi:WD40 repeat protein